MGYDKEIWNECFEKISDGLKSTPIHYKDSHNLRGKVYLEELYQDADINFNDGLDQLLDLIAYLIREGGFTIVKK